MQVAEPQSEPEPKADESPIADETPNASPIADEAPIASKDNPWNSTHEDWKENVCHSSIAAHDEVPDSEQGALELLREVFRKVDFDHSGGLDVDEFGELLRTLDPHIWTDTQIAALFEAADEDDNGQLDIHELVHFVLGAEYEIASASEGSEHGDGFGDGTDTMQTVDIIGTGSSKGKKIQKPRKQDEVLITADKLYDMMTMKDGRLGGKVTLEDFVELWVDSVDAGLTIEFHAYIPQKNDNPDKAAEDISPLQLAQICMILKDNPEATADDILEQIFDAGEQCMLGAPSRSLTTLEVDAKRVIKDKGIDLQMPVTLKLYKRLLEVLEEIMKIDEGHMLIVFSYIKTSVFDMTTIMCNELLSKVLLKVAPKAGKLVETPVTQSDFARMLQQMGLLDNSEKTGMHPGKVAIFYGKILKEMQTLKLDREAKRKKDLGASIKKKPSKKKYLYVYGRSQISILLEELYKALPGHKKTFGSPFKLVFEFLTRAEQLAEEKARPASQQKAKPKKKPDA